MDYLNDFSSILTKLSDLKKSVTVIQNEIRSLESKVLKDQKKANKKKEKNKKVSGFATPSKISENLCEFLGKEKGTTMARTEVTKYLHEYIKKNSLQVQDNKTLIIPDKNLKNLLNLEEEEKEIHFFNLQKYMNQHFLNN